MGFWIEDDAYRSRLEADLCSSCVHAVNCLLREGNDGFVYACGEYEAKPKAADQDRPLADPLPAGQDDSTRPTESRQPAPVG